MIKDDVKLGHLARFPDELRIVQRLEPDFDVTWAKRTKSFNTELSVYFLKPRQHISQTFGFEQELVLAISSFPTLEARAIQSIEEVFQTLPARGRVDQTAAIILSAARQTDEWIRDYTARNPQNRAYVGISIEEIMGQNDPWFLRNKLLKQLFSRDLFDYTLPLDSDLFFFGRAATVADHIDAIRRSENRGIFGLRKTGKTSVLFKIRRECADSNIPVLYYDCKIPSIYRLRGDELLDRICHDVSTLKLQISSKWRHKPNATDRFIALIESLPEGTKICLVFDEVEYITAQSKLAPHWQSDYVPFWQALWSSQSQARRFSFIIAGVNATLVERDKIDGVQNPLFGIVKSRYLTGFERAEVFSLLSVFGRRMGLSFDESAVDALFNRYGGHPLLTRMICSQIHNAVKVSSASRPIGISSTFVARDQSEREEEISFYCGHITSELEDFYPDEFQMLEMLAIGNVVDFNELAQDIDLVRHLKSYGLVDLSEPHVPKFRIPVIQKYIASQWRRTNSQKSERYVVPPHRRAEYVSGRLSSILRDLRSAEQKFSSMGLSSLYNMAGPSEAEKFSTLGVVANQSELVSFINQVQRSIVEPIDRVGAKVKIQNYFFTTINKDYPKLWDGINRARAYRNWLLHLELNKAAREHLDHYLTVDFDKKDPSSEPDGMFRVQAAILDGLIIGIQSEMATYD